MNVSLWLLPVLLCLTLIPAQARLGETLEQCTARYGDVVSTNADAIGEKGVVYQKNGYIIAVVIFNGRAARETFGKINGNALSDNEMKTLLDSESSSGNLWLDHDNNDAHQTWVREDNAVALYDKTVNALLLETHDYVTAQAAKQKAGETNNLNGF
jgi:hypothetical protein